MKHTKLENLLRQTLLPDGQPLSTASLEKFSAYYQLVLKWNARLHLTTITEPQAFLQRHLLESAWLVAQIETGVRQIWDIGSGLGVPGVIVAILRPDLSVALVEASLKKAVFLEEVEASLRLENLSVIQRRFQDLPPLLSDACLTARALEKMGAGIADLLKLSGQARQILLLGNEDLKERVIAQSTGVVEVKDWPLPGAERRRLISLRRNITEGST